MRSLLMLVCLLAGSAAARAEGPVYVVTHIDLMPAGTPTGLALLKQFGADTAKEENCVRFEILQQEGRPNHLTLVGIWKDQKSFDAHDSAPYTKQFREKCSR